MADILSRRDRGIYFAIGTDLVAPHPLGKELDDMVTRMAFAAMHRNGEPFSMPPALDDSPGATAPIEMPPFEPAAPITHPLPAPDGALYRFASSGWVPAIGVPERFPPKPSPPPAPPVPAPFKVLPVPDGALWQISSAGLSRLEGPLQDR